MKLAVNAASMTTPSSRPGTSARRLGLTGDSEAYRRSRTMVSRQTGTLTRKIERQPATVTRMPPATGPSATPSEPIPPQTPSARARARGSGNWCTNSASEQGSMADAPRPWTARAAMRTPSAGAAAQAAEPRAKATSPRVKTFRAPTRSAVEPAVSMIAARASVYASTTHCSPASEPPISRWMAGSATFTIVTSSWITKKPRQTEMSAAAARPRAGGSALTRVPAGRLLDRSRRSLSILSSLYPGPSKRSRRIKLLGPVRLP